MIRDLPQSLRTRRLLIPVVLLLLIAVSRIVHLAALPMGTDEIWAIWQTFGTPIQVIRWTPSDWTPVYYLILWLWQHLVGLQPLALHVLSLLAYLIGCAFNYRLMRRLAGDWAGLLGLAVFGALGYSVYVSTEVRGYTFIVSLLPLVLWMIVRYFAHPNWRRAVALGLSMAGLFALHLSSIIAFVLIGVYTLVIYRQRIWLWWRPALVAVIAASPFILSKIQLMLDHERMVPALTRQPLSVTLDNVLLYFGNNLALWIALFVFAVTLLVVHRPRRIEPFAMIVALPVAAAFTYWVMALDNIRYFWWGIAGYTLIMGWGLAYLWAELRAVLLLVFAILIFFPIPIDQYQRYEATDVAMLNNFQFLSQHIRWGDVLVVDPNAQYSSYEGLDYATHVYFPNGLQYVSNPQGYRRVWYITHETHEDPALMEAVGRGRIGREWVGPPTFLLRLFEAPPDQNGILFDNGLRYMGMDVLDDNGEELTGPFVRHAGESIRLRLWWAVDKDYAAKGDYFFGIYIFGPDGKPITDSSSVPKVVDQPDRTSQWTANAYFLDNRLLNLPYPTQNGVYHLALAVYDPITGERVSAPGADENQLLPLGTFTVKSW